MDFNEIMNVIKTFLDAIVKLLKSLGLDKLFNKEDPADETTTAA